MTSRHASGSARRGVASWLIVTVVAVVVLAGVAVAYVFITRDDEQGAAGDCSSPVVLSVVASPGAAAAIAQAAAGFDGTRPVARSACVTTRVSTVPGDQARLGLTNGWAGQQADPPAMWVTDTAADLEALESEESALTSGRDTAPAATSPVVLAVRSEDAAAVTASGLRWQDLATATGPDGTVLLPSDRHLVLALPDPAHNRATSYALQSFIVASGGLMHVPGIAAAATDLAAVGAGGPTVQPVSTQDALTQLAAGTAGFTAVPVVASDLEAFSTVTPGLTAISPAGGTVGDAVYPVPLSADWVTPAQDDAAALFAAYLRGPAGEAAFTDHGLTVTSSDASGPSTTFGPPPLDGAVPDAGPDVAEALATAIGARPSG